MALLPVKITYSDSDSGAGRRLPFLGGQQALAGQEVLPLCKGVCLQPPASARSIHAAIAGDYRAVLSMELELHGQGETCHRVLDLGHAAHGLHLRILLPEPGATVLVREVHGSDAVWVLAPDGSFPRAGLVASDAQGTAFDAFLANLRKGAITQFGWNLGCVTEACADLADCDTDATEDWLACLAGYLEPFLSDEGGLHYQDYRGRVESEGLSVEAGLPIAALSAHPALASRHRELGRRLACHWLAGVAPDRDHLTAEGSYCTAYPMLQTAHWISASDPALAEGLRQAAGAMLHWRRAGLSLPKGLALRNHSGELSFVNWARAWAWYLLGEARSAMIEPAQCPQDQLAAQCALALQYQRSDGLWGGFVDDVATMPDTSGSSGIAAALLWAARLGWLPPEQARASALACWRGLATWIDEAGWLHGNCPSNRRGEDFQRAANRDANPFALGLAGQLYAGLLREGVPRYELAAAWEQARRNRESLPLSFMEQEPRV